MSDTTDTVSDIDNVIGTDDEPELTGKFFNTLTRPNSKIRKDRAISIVEIAQLKYKRKIEDMEQEVKDLKRDQNNMLDLSPRDANSLVLASDFDVDSFVAKHIEIGVKLRNLAIKLEVAKSGYKNLFE